MLDPITFAIAVATALAAILSGQEAPTEVLAPAPVVVTQEVIGEAPVVPEAPTEELTFNELGWVTYSDGAVKCATAAPCEQSDAFTGPEDSTYNWVTGVDYADTLTEGETN